MQDDFGTRVRQARDDLGWSQEDLAKRADVGRTAVTRIENGSVPLLNTASRICFALAEEVNELSAPWVAQFLTGRSLPNAGNLASVRRREFMAWMATAAALPSTIPSPMLDLDRLDTSPLEPAVLAELEKMTAQLARTRPMVAPRRWLQQGEAHLADLEARMDERSSASVLGRGLISLIASTCALCAWVCLSAERRRDCRAYLDHGELAAREVGNDDVLALLYMLRADALSSVPTGGAEGFPDEARRLLDEAMALTSDATPVSLRVPIFWRAAEEQAFIRDQGKALHYLMRGQDMAATGRELLHPLRPFWGPIAEESFRGSCLGLMGRSREAVDLLEPLVDQANPWHRPLILADLGAAHAQLGDAAAAVEVITRGVEMVESGGYTGAGRRMLGVRNRHLERWKAEPAVRELDKRLSAIL
jgi:transcriptional regulator with XRE-family HTH domain